LTFSGRIKEFPLSLNSFLRHHERRQRLPEAAAEYQHHSGDGEGVAHVGGLPQQKVKPG